MAVSKKQQASVTKYVKDHYDRISVTVPKGERERIRVHAASHGESVNAFVNRAIDETMERDNLPDVPEGKPRRLKDGSFKWGDLRFANEEELDEYLDKNIPISD